MSAVKRCPPKVWLKRRLRALVWNKVLKDGARVRVVCLCEFIRRWVLSSKEEYMHEYMLRKLGELGY